MRNIFWMYFEIQNISQSFFAYPVIYVHSYRCEDTSFKVLFSYSFNKFVAICTTIQVEVDESRRSAGASTRVSLTNLIRGQAPVCHTLIPPSFTTSFSGPCLPVTLIYVGLFSIQSSILFWFHTGYLQNIYILYIYNRYFNKIIIEIWYCFNK